MPRNFSLAEEHVDGLRIIAVSGDLDLRTSRELRTEVGRSLVTGPPRALAIDLRDCSFIDSTAISVLLRSQGAADEKDVDFALIADTESQPYRVLRLTRCLPDRIRGFASREEAAGALSPPA